MTDTRMSLCAKKKENNNSHINTTEIKETILQWEGTRMSSATGILKTEEGRRLTFALFTVRIL